MPWAQAHGPQPPARWAASAQFTNTTCSIEPLLDSLHRSQFRLAARESHYCSNCAFTPCLGAFVRENSHEARRRGGSGIGKATDNAAAAKKVDFRKRVSRRLGSSDCSSRICLQVHSVQSGFDVHPFRMPLKQKWLYAE